METTCRTLLNLLKKLHHLLEEEATALIMADMERLNLLQANVEILFEQWHSLEKLAMAQHAEMRTELLQWASLIRKRRLANIVLAEASAKLLLEEKSILNRSSAAFSGYSAAEYDHGSFVQRGC